jgi:DNA-binding transcriptional LysR family regulator
MLSLDAILLVETIARQGSFALAAEELGKAVASLSYAVRKIEQDLDILLFDRSGHRARLTPAGQLLLEEGLPLLESAGRLEARIKQVANGWEPQLAIVLDTLLPWPPLIGLVQEFTAVAPATQVRLRQEVLAGNWDALLHDRADLVIGAPGRPPQDAGLRSRPLLVMPFVFVVSPLHPLARGQEPLDPEHVQHYRAAAIADSSRRLPARSSGLLDRQPVLSVPTLEAKLAAQRAGLCVGWLPEWLAREEIRAGRLLEKKVASGSKQEDMQIAWRSGNQGRALQWFLKRLRGWDALQMTT